MSYSTEAPTPKKVSTTTSITTSSSAIPASTVVSVALTPVKDNDASTVPIKNHSFDGFQPTAITCEIKSTSDVAGSAAPAGSSVDKTIAASKYDYNFKGIDSFNQKVTALQGIISEFMKESKESNATLCSRLDKQEKLIKAESKTIQTQIKIENDSTKSSVDFITSKLSKLMNYYLNPRSHEAVGINYYPKKDETDVPKSKSSSIVKLPDLSTVVETLSPISSIESKKLVKSPARNLADCNESSVYDDPNFYDSAYYDTDNYVPEHDNALVDSSDTVTASVVADDDNDDDLYEYTLTRSVYDEKNGARDLLVTFFYDKNFKITGFVENDAKKSRDKYKLILKPDTPLPKKYVAKPINRERNFEQSYLNWTTPRDNGVPHGVLACHLSSTKDKSDYRRIRYTETQSLVTHFTLLVTEPDFEFATFCIEKYMVECTIRGTASHNHINDLFKDTRKEPTKFYREFQKFHNCYVDNKSAWKKDFNKKRATISKRH